MMQLHLNILLPTNTPIGFFQEEEFACADSAYTLNKHTIPVHCKPASLQCQIPFLTKL